jgi:hypothetical protein
MRHSDIALTMNTYTDEKLLETSAAVELLPDLPISKERAEAKSFVAPTVAPTSYKSSQDGSKPGKMTGKQGLPQKQETRTKPTKKAQSEGFSDRASGMETKGLEPSTSALRTQRSPS